MEPCEDDREAAGKPGSTDGVQRGAAHGPAGQGRAGELISASVGKVQGRFIVGGFGLVCDVDGRFDDCLSHCLAQKWAKSSPFMWELSLLSLEKAAVCSVDHDKDCFFKRNLIFGIVLEQFSLSH